MGETETKERGAKVMRPRGRYWASRKHELKDKEKLQCHYHAVNET
jgi:hypothetical protein